MDNPLMQVKSIAECSVKHSAVLLTCIKTTYGFKPLFFSIYEWLLKTTLCIFKKLINIRIGDK